GGRGATLEFWVRLEGTTGRGGSTAWTSRGITGREDGTSSAHQNHDDIFWGWVDNTGGIGVSHNNDTAAKATPPADAWHHVVLIREDDGDTDAYLDGVRVANDVSGTNEDGAVAFTDIGRLVNSTTPYFQ